MPAPPPGDVSYAFSHVLYEHARRENMTRRDLYNLTAAARWHWVLCGTPKRIADTLEEWFVEEAADGFRASLRAGQRLVEGRDQRPVPVRPSSIFSAASWRSSSSAVGISCAPTASGSCTSSMKTGK